MISTIQPLIPANVTRMLKTRANTLMVLASCALFAFFLLRQTRLKMSGSIPANSHPTNRLIIDQGSQSWMVAIDELNVGTWVTYASWGCRWGYWDGFPAWLIGCWEYPGGRYWPPFLLCEVSGYAVVELKFSILWKKTFKFKNERSLCFYMLY